MGFGIKAMRDISENSVIIQYKTNMGMISNDYAKYDENSSVSKEDFEL